MNFNQARRLLREQGYKIDRRPGYGVRDATYKVWRTELIDGKAQIFRWELTAEDIKCAVFTARRQSNQAIELVSVQEVANG